MSAEYWSEAKRVSAFAIRLGSAKGAGPAPESIRNHLVVIKRMMAVAVEWELIDANPALQVTPPRVARPEITFLTPHEVQRLIAATDEEYRLLIATACLAGAR